MPHGAGRGNRSPCRGPGSAQEPLPVSTWPPPSGCGGAAFPGDVMASPGAVSAPPPAPQRLPPS
eukprot:4654817-Lingulodinium_polyedra.AAC.1